MAEHNELGEKGEFLAVEFLIEKGYKILHRNYRYLKAEVDIIALKEDILVAVEVKTRATAFFGNPEAFITAKKIKLLLSAVDYYVQENNLEVDVRFDIIAIIGKQTFNIEHIEDAFLYF